MAPRETEDNAYAKFWSDKQRALWYAMVLLEWFNSQRGRGRGVQIRSIYRYISYSGVLLKHS